MCIFRGLPRNLQKQTRARLSHLVERTHVASLLTAFFPTHECDLQINNKLPERDRGPKGAFLSRLAAASVTRHTSRGRPGFACDRVLRRLRRSDSSALAYPPS